MNRAETSTIEIFHSGDMIIEISKRLTQGSSKNLIFLYAQTEKLLHFSYV